jgi:hypothetical protein
LKFNLEKKDGITWFEIQGQLIEKYFLMKFFF